MNPNKLTQAWTAAEDELLAKLWKEGKSASIIAARFAGRSRCSILGRIHRNHRDIVSRQVRHRKPHGVEIPRVKPVLAKPEAPTKISLALTVSKKAQGNGYHFHGGKVRKPRHAVKPAPASPRTTGKPIPFLALRDSLCKFAVSGAGGHLDPFKFCGQPVRTGVSYCEHHCEIVFTGLAQKSLRTLPRDRRQQFHVGAHVLAAE